MLAAAASLAVFAAPPSIVLSIIDDLGFFNVGFRNEEARTPAIDALAKAGVVLDRFCKCFHRSLSSWLN